MAGEPFDAGHVPCRNGELRGTVGRSAARVKRRVAGSALLCVAGVTAGMCAFISESQGRLSRPSPGAQVPPRRSRQQGAMGCSRGVDSSRYDAGLRIATLVAGKLG